MNEKHTTSTLHCTENQCCYTWQKSDTQPWNECVLAAADFWHWQWGSVNGWCCVSPQNAMGSLYQKYWLPTSTNSNRCTSWYCNFSYTKFYWSVHRTQLLINYIIPQTKECTVPSIQGLAKPDDSFITFTLVKKDGNLPPTLVAPKQWVYPTSPTAGTRTWFPTLLIIPSPAKWGWKKDLAGW